MKTRRDTFLATTEDMLRAAPVLAQDLEFNLYVAKLRVLLAEACNLLSDDQP